MSQSVHKSLFEGISVKPLSFSYGENTSIKVSILNADFHVNILPLQQTALVEVELTVVNDKVHSDIEGNFKFPLPEGATVVRYAFEVEGKMIDAMSLPKRKAAEVAYREREAGRNVSKTEQVEGNLFETTIFPLKYMNEHRLIITYKAGLMSVPKDQDEKFQWRIVAPFFFESPLKSIRVSTNAYPKSSYIVQNNINDHVTNSSLEQGLVIVVGSNNAENQGLDPEVIAGKYIGKLHFSTYLSRKLILEKLKHHPLTATKAEPEKHVCVLWDNSQSSSQLKNDVKILSELEKLQKARGTADVKFTVYTFSTDVNLIGEKLSADAAVKLLSEISYDGGTNISVLGKIFIAQSKKETKFDYFLLCTDGVDNIGNATRLPEGIPEVGTPIHVVSPSTAEHVNSSLLKNIAFQTRGSYGKAGEQIVKFITGTDPALAVTKLKTIFSSQDRLMELLENEEFTTVPDYKLSQEFTYWPVNENGVLISGTLPPNKETFPESLQVTVTVPGTEFQENIYVPIQNVLGNLTDDSSLGCLVGVIHCQNMIDESSYISFDPEFSKSFIEEVGKKYNIATQHSSLLLLHKAEQFIDNEVTCPSFHPEHERWKKLKVARETSKEIAEVSKKISWLNKLQQYVGLASTLVRINNSTALEETEINLKISTARTVLSEYDQIWAQLKDKTEQDYQNIITEYGKCETINQTIRDLLAELSQARADGLQEEGKKSEIEAKFSAEKNALDSVLYPEISSIKINEISGKRDKNLSTIQKESGDYSSPIREHIISFQKNLTDLETKARLETEYHKKFVEQDKKTMNSLQQELSELEQKSREQEKERLRAELEEKKKEKEKDKENEEKKGKKKKKKEEKEEKDEDGGEDEEREAHEERSDRESYRRRSSVLSDEIPEILNYASHSLNTFFMESLSGAGPGENFQNFLFSSIQPEVPISHFDKFCESVEEISRKRSEINFVDLKGLERNLQQIEKDFEMGLSNAISRSKTLVATVESRISTALSEHRAIITTHSPSEWQAYDAQNQKATKLAKASLESNTRPYLEPICKHLSKGEIDEAYKEYLRQRDLSANSKSPSFYIYCSRLFHAGEAPRELSMKIVTNTIEMNVQDTQMFRSVAYFMLEIGLITEAIILFRKVQDKAPAEPQSFLDLGLALYMDVRNKIKEGQDKEKVLPQLKEAISEIGKVITGNWVDRFREIEWPAIIYINWMVGYGLHHGMGDLWPDSQVTRTFHVPNLSLGLFVSMGWDTDHTDIDLHVYEPDRNHVYYSNKCDRLSRDFTQGYGPECYTNKFPTCGIYTISAHYYASSQKSSSTGTTSCVLWSLKNLGKFDSEEILFQMVRLDTNQSQLTVMMVAIIRD